MYVYVHCDANGIWKTLVLNSAVTCTNPCDFPLHHAHGQTRIVTMPHIRKMLCFVTHPVHSHSVDDLSMVYKDHIGFHAFESNQVADKYFTPPNGGKPFPSLTRAQAYARTLKTA